MIHWVLAGRTNLEANRRRLANTRRRLQNLYSAVRIRPSPP
ncbi:hypothetical protein GBAR_LOCUS2899, partial [Geodia barretti]